MPFILLCALPALAEPGGENHVHVGLGPYTHVTDAGAVSLEGVDPTALDGFEITSYTSAEDLSEALEAQDLEGADLLVGQRIVLRAYMDDTRTLQIDRLQIDGQLGSLRVRPELGDVLDIGLLGGSSIRRLGETGDENTHVELLAPWNLTLLGFSNTDQDEDEKLKHYISIGTGLGADLVARAAGPLGVHLRLLAEARTQNRHRKDAKNYVRHEITGEVEGGPALLTEHAAFSLTGWGEAVTQWETRDDDRRSGVDRQTLSWGVRLGMRFFGRNPSDRTDEVIPEGPPDAVARR